MLKRKLQFNLLVILGILFVYLQSGYTNNQGFLPVGIEGKVNHYTGFSLQYSEKYEQALWVAYDLTKEEVLNKVTKRTDDFRIDPTIVTGSATLADYKGSGYDRGHLAPAADMGWSYRSMSESFLLSNMSPQKPSFNRGIWKKLEEQVRSWAIIKNKVYVITGPIFYEIDDGIGLNHVDIPDAYFKIIFDYSGYYKKIIAFILQHEGPKNPLSKFQRPVDDIEKLTGLDFFSNLEDTLEEKLESSITLFDWKYIKAKREYKQTYNNEPNNKSTGSGLYWITNSSKKRHNSKCRWFKKSKGKLGQATEGIPCKICGG